MCDYVEQITPPPRSPYSPNPSLLNVFRDEKVSASLRKKCVIYRNNGDHVLFLTKPGIRAK